MKKHLEFESGLCKFCMQFSVYYVLPEYISWSLNTRYEVLYKFSFALQILETTQHGSRFDFSTVQNFQVALNVLTVLSYIVVVTIPYSQMQNLFKITMPCVLGLDLRRLPDKFLTFCPHLTEINVVIINVLCPSWLFHPWDNLREGIAVRFPIFIESLTGCNFAGGWWIGESMATLLPAKRTKFILSSHKVGTLKFANNFGLILLTTSSPHTFSPTDRKHNANSSKPSYLESVLNYDLSWRKFLHITQHSQTCQILIQGLSLTLASSENIIQFLVFKGHHCICKSTYVLVLMKIHGAEVLSKLSLNVQTLLIIP